MGGAAEEQAPQPQNYIDTLFMSENLECEFLLPLSPRVQRDDACRNRDYAHHRKRRDNVIEDRHVTYYTQAQSRHDQDDVRLSWLWLWVRLARRAR